MNCKCERSMQNLFTASRPGGGHKISLYWCKSCGNVAIVTRREGRYNKQWYERKIPKSQFIKYTMDEFSVGDRVLLDVDVIGPLKVLVEEIKKDSIVLKYPGGKLESLSKIKFEKYRPVPAITLTTWRRI